MSETNPNAATPAEECKPAAGSTMGQEVAAVAPAGPVSTDSTPTIISKTPPQPGPVFRIGEPLRGRQLAHFELIEAVGVGGMAAVIKARDLQLDRFVALKVLPPE